MNNLILSVLLAILGSLLVGGVWLYLKLQQEFARLASDDPKVWESTIAKFELEDHQQGIPKNAVLFVGSSSIRFWRTLKADMAPIPVIRRGFGGSKMRDLIYFSDRIILPYRPKAIVIFAGSNDVTGRPNDKSPQQVADDFKELVRLIHSALPQTPVYYLSITPTTARWSVWPALQAANQLIAQFAEQNPQLHFLDASPLMLKADGTCRDDLLWWDGLHLNRKGYQAWTRLVKENLRD